MRILIQVIAPLGLEAARPQLDAVHAVAVLQQHSGQVTAVLARDAGDQGCLRRSHADGS